MHELLEQDRDDIYAIRLTGEVNKASYDELMPIFEEKIAKHGKISVYLELQLFENWTPTALLQEIKYDIKHAQHLKRVAMVGNLGKLSWLVMLAKPFTSARIRNFKITEREEAWNWVRAED